jgi:FkbM family methyltransferase
MNSKKLKYLIRSKSFKFAKNLEDKSHRISSLIWNNINVHYRASSSDMVLIYEILLKSKYKREYYFPEELKPKVIFDIGGNIGITSIYLASVFPDATIYTFEPLKENFEILQKNASQFKNIKVFNVGLGAENGSFKVYLSDDNENYGGVSFYSEVEGNLSESFSECEVKNINVVVDELGISTVDLIKIDTEGAEYDILTSLKYEFLKKTSWITGELHGNRDFELLNYLTNIGFSISLNKNIDNRLFMFNAGKKEVVSKLSRKQVKIL